MQAGAEHVGPDVQPADRQALHRHDGADREEEGADRADERPGARVDEMVVVVLGVGLGHGRVVSVPRADQVRPAISAASESVTL